MSRAKGPRSRRTQSGPTSDPPGQMSMSMVMAEDDYGRQDVRGREGQQLGRGQPVLAEETPSMEWSGAVSETQSARELGTPFLSNLTAANAGFAGLIPSLNPSVFFPRPLVSPRALIDNQVVHELDEEAILLADIARLQQERQQSAQVLSDATAKAARIAQLKIDRAALMISVPAAARIEAAGAGETLVAQKVADPPGVASGDPSLKHHFPPVPSVGNESIVGAVPLPIPLGVVRPPPSKKRKSSVTIISAPSKSILKGGEIPPAVGLPPPPAKSKVPVLPGAVEDLGSESDEELSDGDGGDEVVVGPGVLDAGVGTVDRVGGGASALLSPSRFSSLPVEIRNLVAIVARCDGAASDVAVIAAEVFQGLVDRHKKITAVKTVNRRESKLNPDSRRRSEQPPTQEELVANSISTFFVPSLTNRVVITPRAMLSLNCFHACNSGHFSWSDNIGSGGTQPRLLPFPANLSARDLLLIFHKFILLMMGVDVCFGIALGSLFHVVEHMMTVSNYSVAVASRYIEDVRAEFDISDEISIFSSLQDSILVKVLQAVGEGKNPKPNVSHVPVGILKPVDEAGRRFDVGFQRRFDNPNPRDFITPRKEMPYVRERDVRSRDDDERERERDRYRERYRKDRLGDAGPPLPAKLLANAHRDSIKQWLSCDDFNSGAGCSKARDLCRYAHVCCNCASPAHNYPNHGQAGGEIKGRHLTIKD